MRYLTSELGVRLKRLYKEQCFQSIPEQLSILNTAEFKRKCIPGHSSLIGQRAAAHSCTAEAWNHCQGLCHRTQVSGGHVELKSLPKITRARMVQSYLRHGKGFESHPFQPPAANGDHANVLCLIFEGYSVKP